MSAKSINDFLIRMFVCVVFFLLFSTVNTISSEKCHQYRINHTTIDNKLALSPVVFQGRLTSMSTPVNDLHFVSLRVLKVIKGKLSKRLRKQIRLLFSLGKRKRQFVNRNKECKDPPIFNPKSSRKKYIFFVQKIKPGSYVALAEPEIFNRKVRRNIRKILCNNCCKLQTTNKTELNNAYTHKLHS
uniref:Vein beta-barrel domain-containing protein n=1 Tax=Lepeophtheirus salmonis TaxID=72036 RepID=A0A0K2V0Q0_LEPSM